MISFQDFAAFIAISIHQVKPICINVPFSSICTAQKMKFSTNETSIVVLKWLTYNCAKITNKLTAAPS